LDEGCTRVRLFGYEHLEPLTEVQMTPRRFPPTLALFLLASGAMAQQQTTPPGPEPTAPTSAPPPVEDVKRSGVDASGAPIRKEAQEELVVTGSRIRRKD